MRTFTVGVRFHTAGCTSPPTKPTASAVKISMAARLLTPKGQTTPTDINKFADEMLRGQTSTGLLPGWGSKKTKQKAA